MSNLDDHVPNPTPNVNIISGQLRSPSDERVTIKLGLGLEEKETCGILPRDDRDHYILNNSFRGYFGSIIKL